MTKAVWRVVVASVVVVACARPSAVAPAAAREHPREAEPLREGASGPVELAALTDDGSAAITEDEFGAIRLWPTIDGTREPMVVPGPPPRELAIARDGPRTFGIAIVDDAHTLTIVAVDARGRIGPPRELGTVVGVTATADTIVAWLADSTIKTFDVHGVLIAAVVAPGQLATVTARDGRILAIVDSPRGAVGYWLAHGALGEPTSVLPFDAGPIAVSPDGVHVAGMRAGSAVIVDLSTGATIDHDAHDEQVGCEPLAFVQRDLLVCSGVKPFPGRIVYWLRLDFATTEVDLATNDKAIRGGPSHDVPVLLAGAAGVALAAESGSLELLARGAPPSYLGYRVVTPGTVRSSPRGLVINAADEGWRLLDDRLAITTALSDGPVDLVPDIVPIDARTTLTLDAEMLGVALRVGSDAVFPDTSTQSIAYEPATKLAAVALDQAIGFVHVDSRRATRVSGTGVLARVWLVDPQLANGAAAVVEDGSKLYVLRATELSGPIHASSRRDEIIVTVDRAGRFYDDDSHSLVVDGRAFANTAGMKLVAPDPTGARVAVAGDRWLALYDDAGVQRWRIVLDEAPRPIWHGDQLFVATETGLARISSETGAIVQARCGWEFGKSDEPPPNAVEVESLCSR